ncbi:DeoR/GlpR family DNA-binding transcription regulator [Actinocrispum sp. NPDC049592]|uniref:DeoR/GlpR family DNA-binding transcription regulator n=1 Tax=Actinocrispum sp. NPDC049592 TaxID=3154835 RepID=UPI0034481C88
MPLVDRLDLTLRFVRESQRISLAELAERLGVSEMTVRRDLDELQAQGLVERVRGGAVALSAPREEAGFERREAWQAATKKRIAARAAKLVEPGQTILLDAGTTTAAVAKSLVSRAPLTVAVLSLQAAAHLADRRGIRLIVLGGESRPGERSLVGPLTAKMLDEMWFDTFVMSIGAVHRELGWSEFDIADAAVKQHALTRAEQTVVVADSTKFGVRAFAKVAALGEVGTLVTDKPDDKDTLAAIRRAGVTTLLA